MYSFTVVWNEETHTYDVRLWQGANLMYQVHTNSNTHPPFFTKQEWAVIPAVHTFVHCETGRIIQHQRLPKVWEWTQMSLSLDQKTWAICEYMMNLGVGWIVFLQVDLNGSTEIPMDRFIIDIHYTVRLEWTSSDTCIVWLGVLWDTHYDLSHSLMMLRWKNPQNRYVAIHNKHECPLEYQEITVSRSFVPSKYSKHPWQWTHWTQHDERYQESDTALKSYSLVERQKRFQFKPLRQVQFIIKQSGVRCIEHSSWDFPCQPWGWVE